MPVRYMNTVAKRLSYVLRQYRDPGVIYWTTKAALEIQGIHDVRVPTEAAALRAFVQKLEPRLGTNPYEKYLPWVAQQLNLVTKRGDDLGPLGTRLSRRLRAIAEWAEAERVDLGRVDAWTALKESTEYEREVEDDVPQGAVVYHFPDGYTVQKLKGKEQLDAEGVVMQHCVGDYCAKVERGDVQVFSVRDPGGKPHVTIEYDPSTNMIVQVRGKQNDEPADKYWPYVGQFIEHIGAGVKKTEVPSDIMEEVEEAYEDVKNVESAAKHAQMLMDKALRAFKSADYSDALGYADEATDVENNYGDAPTTWPFYDTVKVAYEDMDEDDDTPLHELPKGTKHPRHDELLERVEASHGTAEGGWADMDWQNRTEIRDDEWYYDSATFQDVHPADPGPGLRDVAVGVCDDFNIYCGEEEDVSKYVEAARHHRWARVANRSRPRSKPRVAPTMRPRAGAPVRRLKRRLISY